MSKPYSITIEELAALFTAACIARLDKTSVDFDTAFRWADEFLAYAAKQREPKACEHEWRQPPYMFNQICHKCGELKPDPPVEPTTKKTQQPERVPKEYWIWMPNKGAPKYLYAYESTYQGVDTTSQQWIKVREILPGDER